MLDIIVMDNRPYSNNYHDRCVNSVREAIANAGFPCKLVETKGNLKAIAKARGAAFDQTTAPYVTWVVDFDYLLPDALAVLKEELAKGPAAVFTREKRLMARGEGLCKRRHHLAVYRRDILLANRQLFETENVNVVTAALQEAAQVAGAVDILHWGYIRNILPDVCEIYKAEIP